MSHKDIPISHDIHHSINYRGSTLLDPRILIQIRCLPKLCGEGVSVAGDSILGVVPPMSVYVQFSTARLLSQRLTYRIKHF